MRYLCIYRAAETGTPPTPEEQAAMGALIEEMAAAGVLLGTEGCLPSARGFRVRREGDEITVTDGPFTESREVVGGFALIQAPSREEAVRWTRRFLEVAGDGESEVRELYEQPAFAGDA